MENKEILIADEGMIYTDGKNYGKKIFYVTAEMKAKYQQITEAEYFEILKKQEAEYDNQCFT